MGGSFKAIAEKLITLMVIFAILVSVSGCGSTAAPAPEAGRASDTQASAPEQPPEAPEAGMDPALAESLQLTSDLEDLKSDKSRLILALDLEDSHIVLKDMDSTRQFFYRFDINTQFTDKNGQYISVAGFMPGRVARVVSVDNNGMLRAISLSDEIWEIGNVTNFSIDESRGIMTIGSDRYRIDDNTAVFSGTTLVFLSDIGEYDTLRVVGKDRYVWGITITTGHGILSLINTELFKDSLICIGNIYTLIKGDMQLEMPEGSYQVTVANKGYGGTTVVTIPRNEVYTLDLDTLKGEGPKNCTITFMTDVPEAVIKLDGKEVSLEEDSVVTYGRHTLSVEAEGYENWQKQLYVNSPTATIKLEMTEEKDSTKNNTSSTDKKEDNDNKKDSREEDPGSQEDDEDAAKEREEEQQKAQLEYLTTISNMVSSLFSD